MPLPPFSHQSQVRSPPSHPATKYRSQKQTAHPSLHILLLCGIDHQPFHVNSHDWIVAANRRRLTTWQGGHPSSQAPKSLGKPILFRISFSVHLSLNVVLKTIKANGTEHVDIIKLILQCFNDGFKQAYKYSVEQRLLSTSLAGHFYLLFKCWELILVI